MTSPLSRPQRRGLTRACGGTAGLFIFIPHFLNFPLFNDTKPKGRKCFIGGIRGYGRFYIAAEGWGKYRQAFRVTLIIICFLGYTLLGSGRYAGFSISGWEEGRGEGCI